MSVSDNDGVSDKIETLGLNTGNDELLVEYFGDTLCANVIDAQHKNVAKMVSKYILSFFFFFLFL